MQIDLSWTEQRKLHRPGFYGKEIIRVHVSQYFLLFRFFLASWVCCDQLGCLGYKYVPHLLCKGFVTRPINKLYFFPCKLLFSRRHRYFFFCEFFRVDQGRLTFERLDLLVSFHLPSKSEIQLPGASLFSRLDLFISYRYRLELQVFPIILAFIRFIRLETRVFGCEIL